MPGRGGELSTTKMVWGYSHIERKDMSDLLM